MPRPKTRPVTIDNMRHAMSQGEIQVYACTDKKRPGPKVKNLEKEDAITVSMHFCTAFLNKEAVADLILALRAAANQQWGKSWVLEVLDAER
jgi:hypothetical protein